MLNEFEMVKILLKTVLAIFLKTCKTVSIKPCINREDKSNSSQFSYTDIFLTKTMKFLEVLTPPSIYHIGISVFGNHPLRTGVDIDKFQNLVTKVDKRMYTFLRRHMRIPSRPPTTLTR